MPTIVIVTTLLAALLHACWNALAKGAADKHLSMAGVIIGHLPYALIGLLSLGLVRSNGGARNPKAAMLAAITGCFIAGYSLIDGLGARVAGTAVGFYGWSAIGNAVVFAAYLRVSKPGTLSRLWPEGRFVLIVGGLASYCAYALVVWGFMQAPIALVTALRETSIIFALFIGVFFMKERLDLMKVFATFTTIIGAILLRFAR